MQYKWKLDYPASQITTQLHKEMQSNTKSVTQYQCFLTSNGILNPMASIKEFSLHQFPSSQVQYIVTSVRSTGRIQYNYFGPEPISDSLMESSLIWNVTRVLVVSSADRLLRKQCLLVLVVLNGNKHSAMQCYFAYGVLSYLMFHWAADQYIYIYIYIYIAYFQATCTM